MKPTNLASAAAAAILVAAAAVTPALAQRADTYVSATGSDAATCVITAPCLTMAHAAAETGSFGVLHCLDSYNYGEVTITQSITIDCSNTTAAAGPFNINATGIVVHIKGVTFWELGNGVDFKAGAALHVENCLFYENSFGILFEPSAAASLFVVNSTFRTNGFSATQSGITIQPAAGVQAKVSIDHSQINGNYFGIVADGRSGGIIKGTISDSVVSGNTENGVTALSSGSNVVFTIDQTKVTNNSAAGLFANGSGAGIVARNSTVYGNDIGLDAASGAALVSFGNNSVNGNTTNGAFTATVSQQ